MSLLPTEYKKIFPNDDEYRERFTAESSKFYYDKMMELINNDRARIHELDGSVPRLILPNHLMYRIDTLHNADKIRSYEFLIEYNIKKPVEGIYYGCRGLTKIGNDHDHAIKLFRQEWELLKGITCQVLNNTFPDKDFSRRFKITNNANTNTYWLFWISLNEDEDINKVGVVATKKIRDVFNSYINGNIMAPVIMPSSKLLTPKTAFFESNYNSLLAVIKDKDDFESIIHTLEEKGLLIPSPLYEKAWVFAGEGEYHRNIDFITLIKNLNEKTHIFRKEKQIPWTLLESTFLNSEGKAFENLRQQAGQIYNADIYAFWEERIKNLIQDLY